MNRIKQAETRKVAQIIDRAVEKSRVPVPSGATISPGMDDMNHLDLEGRPVRGFMLGVDALGAPRRFLVVKGKKRNYHG